MTKPLYKNEQPLFWIATVIAALFWGVVAFSSGMALLILPVFFILYLFFQSGFISYLKGTGAIVSADQFPEIDARVQECAQTLDIKKIPTVFILNGDGLINAFATRFLNKNYIILLSDTLNALEDTPEAINFYIAHEMGHLDRKHLIYEPFLAPALILPLLGAAYSRAREYTCDQYGMRCCSNYEAAQKALALIGVGPKNYKKLNIKSYLDQVQATSEFWMSFHELLASYPWLTKRIARITPEEFRNKIPNRNIFAYIPALIIPKINILGFAIIYAGFVFGAIGGHLVKDFDKIGTRPPQKIEDAGYLDGATEEIRKQSLDAAVKDYEERNGQQTQPVDQTIYPDEAE